MATKVVLAPDGRNMWIQLPSYGSPGFKQQLDKVKGLPRRKYIQPGGGLKLWQVRIEDFELVLKALPDATFSEDVVKASGTMRVQNDAALKVKELTDADVEIRRLKGKLYPYQNVGVAFLNTLGRGDGAILAYDMGLGKSMTSLAYALLLLEAGVIKHVLVVCPSPLKYATWEKEIKKWSDASYIVVDGDLREQVEFEDGTVQTLTGRDLRAVQYQQWEWETEFTVMNYELFLHDSEGHKWEKFAELSPQQQEAVELKTLEIIEQEYPLYEKSTNEQAKEKIRKESQKVACAMAAEAAFPDHSGTVTVRKSGKKFAFFKKVAVPNILPPIDSDWMVILDESHRIKNPKAATTQALFKHLGNAGRKVLLSGTPMENNIEELWSIVDFARQGLLGSFSIYKQTYMQEDYTGYKWEPKPEMMPHLKDRIAPIMLRKTKKEALPDLPELTVQDYWVELTAKQEEIYKDLREGILQSMDGETQYLEILAQLTRLQQLADSPALLRAVIGDPNLPVESGKVNELPGLLDEINAKTENKVIIFSQYKEMTDILYPMLCDYFGGKMLGHKRVRYISGGVKDLLRAQYQREFQESDEVRAIIITTAGNYGLDLYAASYVICFDELFNPQKMQQIYSRAHRNGQKNAVTAINLRTRGTVEERKAELLEQKRGLFAAMIDNDDEAFARLFTLEELKGLI